ncbi:MAG: methyltransferase domain-containing protein [Chloroflexota bacterium]
MPWTHAPASPAAAPAWRQGRARGDAGCGPVGALPILAELVGPSGVVVGVDTSAAALAQARGVLDEAGLTAVELVQADINADGLAAVSAWAPYDLAICHLVLMHQANPAATLRTIARSLQPGARIVAIDQVFDPGSPRCGPRVPAITRIFALHEAHMRHRGAAPDVAWRYADLCIDAGLRLIEQQGFFTMHATDAAIVLDISGAILSTQREGLVRAGLTHEGEVEALLAEVDAARVRGLRLSTSPVFVELIAEVA